MPNCIESQSIVIPQPACSRLLTQNRQRYQLLVEQVPAILYMDFTSGEVDVFGDEVAIEQTMVNYHNNHNNKSIFIHPYYQLSIIIIIIIIIINHHCKIYYHSLDNSNSHHPFPLQPFSHHSSFFSFSSFCINRSQRNNRQNHSTALTVHMFIQCEGHTAFHYTYWKWGSDWTRTLWSREPNPAVCKRTPCHWDSRTWDPNPTKRS